MPLAVIIPENNSRVVIREFVNTLATATTRRTCAGFVRIAACDSNRDDALTARRNHCCNRTGFGAAALRVRSVFDIAANVNLAVLIKNGCTDVIARVGAIGFFSYYTSDVEKFLIGHGVIRPSA